MAAATAGSHESVKGHDQAAGCAEQFDQPRVCRVGEVASVWSENAWAIGLVEAGLKGIEESSIAHQIEPATAAD